MLHAYQFKVSLQRSLHQSLVSEPLKKIRLFIVVLGFLIVSNAAFAAGDIPTITTALEGILSILTGKSAKLIATLAIAGVGYYWLSGRLSLKYATIIGVGIGIIFGAPQIASMLGAG
jgi:type IV secretory pathway VirB2 component (pilin)